MMKAYIKYLSVLDLLLLSMTGCHMIKENRMECPMRIYFSKNVNLHGCETPASVRIIRGNEISISGEFPMNEFVKEGFSVISHRGENICSVVCGKVPTGCNVQFGGGEPVEEVYALAEHYVAGPEDEEYTVRKALCRQTAKVKLTLINGSGDYSPLDLKLLSHWVGFDISTLDPVAGDCICEVLSNCIIPEGGLTIEFFVPRQGDGSLQLELVCQGETVSVYPLGEAIINSGYDWNSEHLEPIEMSIKYSCVSMTVILNRWWEETVKMVL